MHKVDSTFDANDAATAPEAEPVTGTAVLVAHAFSSSGSPVLTLEQQWFLQFFAGILICVSNGACFTLAIFSPFMKRGAFSYDQSQVNLVATVGVLLSYFSMPNGYLYDRKGPRATLLVGTLLNVMGWAGMLLIFLDMKHPLLSSNVVVMCLFYGLAQFSASFYETGSVLTNLRAFSCYKGRVVLIQKTFMGLGSSLVAQIYVAFFEDSFDTIAPFFLFLLGFSAVAGVLSVCCVRLPSRRTCCLGLNVPTLEMLERGGGEPTMFDKPFTLGTGLLVCSVAFVLLASAVENFVLELGTGIRVFVGFTTITIVLSFASMIFVTPSYQVNVGGFHECAEDAARREALLQTAVDVRRGTGECLLEETPRAARATEELGEGRPAAALVAVRTAHDYGAASTSSPVAPVAPVVLNEAPLLTNLRHREMWLLWYVCFASWGAMTLISGNSSQIYQAVAYHDFSLTVNTVFVSVYGAASAMGRILVGAALPLMERRRIPVATFLVAAPVINLVGIPLFLFVPARALAIPFFIVGLATGVSWGSTVLIVTSFFATFNCGKHYSWLYTAGMLSPIIFNVSLFGPTYDHYSHVQGRNDDHSCEGVICFAAPLLVCFAINAIAVPCAVYFTERTTKRGGLRV